MTTKLEATGTITALDTGFATALTLTLHYSWHSAVRQTFTLADASNAAM